MAQSELSSLVFSSPLLLLAAIAIKLESRGPLFYSQIRAGELNQDFRIWKLRSMITDAEKNGPQWASKTDCRVTRVGRILRLTRIDEIPQFWNLLKGEMSLIGPRPERPEFVRELMKSVPFYEKRLAVTPGLSGWAQINYPYGASTEDAIIKLKYDLYYIKNQSISLDTQIALRTINAMLRGSR